MKVQDLMTYNVQTCSPETNLAAVASMMWENDCGVLPVVDKQAKAVGILTDRDTAIALGTRNQHASEIAAADVMSHILHSVSPSDDIHTALKLMRREKVHRLPVLDDNGNLAGILSLNDVALEAQPIGTKAQALNYEDVVSTLKALCEHRHPLVKPLQAAATA
jgi:CBS domain-containing protein